MPIVSNNAIIPYNYNEFYSNNGLTMEQFILKFYFLVEFSLFYHFFLLFSSSNSLLFLILNFQGDNEHNFLFSLANNHTLLPYFPIEIYKTYNQ